MESAIRDACDLGCLVTQVTDARATFTAARQAALLAAIRACCREVTTDGLIAELDRQGGPPMTMTHPVTKCGVVRARRAAGNSVAPPVRWAPVASASRP